MILGFTGCWITARDYSLCMREIERLQKAGSTLAEILAGKLESAVLTEPQKLAANVVTLDSRVEFSIDDCEPEQRTLVHDASHHAIGLHLFLATPRGVGLLGMRAGQACTILENGRQRNLRVRQVLFQPHWRQEPDGGPAASVIELSAFRTRSGDRSGGSPLPTDTIQTREIR